MHEEQILYPSAAAAMPPDTAKKNKIKLVMKSCVVLDCAKQQQSSSAFSSSSSGLPPFVREGKGLRQLELPKSGERGIFYCSVSMYFYGLYDGMGTS